MKTKAKDDLLQFSSEESQSEDDEDGWKLTEDVEKEFFKTLSQIKNKDPKIYERNIEFFKDVPIPTNKVINHEKSNPITLRDYERTILIEKGGEFSDEEPSQNRSLKPKEPTYVEEQESLKNSLKAVVNSSSEDEAEEEWGGLFKKRQKTKEDEKKEEETYKEWLKGQKNSAPDEEVERDMKSLRDYWTSPNLNGDEQFLRDYVLNKKFLDHEDKEASELHSSKLIEKEEESQEQVELGNEFNHRFEEPDQEFIKRYPRQMENSLRRKNEHRKKKREEVKERKLKEKEKKRAEIKNSKKRKRKELEDKIEELKTLTGNKQLAFDNILDQDFDLDEHDKAMKHLFNEEFYSQDDPNFYPSGSKGQEDAWNEEIHTESKEEEDDNDSINCEDPNFNMDCDYDPGHIKPKQNISRSRRRKDKHRRTTVSEVVNQEKPTFDPTTHQSFQEYLDQYYAIDCEDFIGDLPCRFKYRRTVPNSYGLTIEEILAADDKELDRWCSIKRIQQLRPEFKERGDVKVYKKKASDEKLKRKILPSLFKSTEDSESVDQEKSKALPLASENSNKENHKNRLDKSEAKFKKESKINLEKTKDPNDNSDVQQIVPTNNKRKLEISQTGPNKKSKISIKNIMSKNNRMSKKNRKLTTSIKKNSKFEKHSTRQMKDSNVFEISDARLLAYGIKPKKFRNKLKYGKDPVGSVG